MTLLMPKQGRLDDRLGVGLHSVMLLIKVDFQNVSFYQTDLTGSSFKESKN